MEDRKYLDELSNCVRCGSCKAFCPTYDEGLTEAMGARGRLTLLRGLLCGHLQPSPLLRERIFSCILCGACEKLCPPQVGITEAIYHGRKLLFPTDRRTRYLRHFMRFSARRPMLGFRIAQVLQYAGINPQKIIDLLGTPRGLTGKNKAERKKLPFTITLPDSPLRDSHQVYKPQRKIGRIALFTGCSTNFLYPRLGKSLINVLTHLGYEVVLPVGEVCCGAPFRSLGMEDDAVELARKNHATFSKLNAEAVLSLCPTCIISIKTHYPNLIGKGLENAMDVSAFLVNVPGSGLELREAKGEGCCGFGGVFSFQNPDISRDLMDKRVDAYRETGADAVVTACPGCMMQLSAADRKVHHVIELVEEAIGETKE